MTKSESVLFPLKQRILGSKWTPKGPKIYKDLQLIGHWRIKKGIRKDLFLNTFDLSCQTHNVSRKSQMKLINTSIEYLKTAP